MSRVNERDVLTLPDDPKCIRARKFRPGDVEEMYVSDDGFATMGVRIARLKLSIQSRGFVQKGRHNFYILRLPKYDRPRSLAIEVPRLPQLTRLLQNYLRLFLHASV